ncbi:hypothetical protein BDR04DRAFT_1106470 [Suillus decipiens]|nr:hypothetical protein BDR04DRAFT_1106470 [Suillus decipiens]
MPTLPSNKKGNRSTSLEARVRTTFATARTESAKLVDAYITKQICSDLSVRLQTDEKIYVLCATFFPLSGDVIKRLIEKAKTRLDDAREKHKLATDASELVKHYKSLILTL